MRSFMAVLVLPLVAGGLQAALLEVSTQWLETNTVAVQAGDTLRVTGDPAHAHAQLAHVDWQGGSLELRGCRLESSAERIPGGLPLVVGPGQHLLLEDSWIQGVPQAVELSGGEVEVRGSTLAATESNIRSSHPSSRLTLRNVNLCASATGLELDSVDTVLIEGALFLTNGTGLRIGAGNQVTLRNCLFQGNEWGIQIAADALPPVLADSVDLVDSRYALIQNLSLQPIDLASAHLDEPAMVTGAWLRTGADPGMPAHPLKAADCPVVIADDDIADEFIVEISNITIDGLPCVLSSIWIYESNLPYSDFTVLRKIVGNNHAGIQINRFGTKFYRATSHVGNWEEQ
jgi:hypothetical protein